MDQDHALSCETPKNRLGCIVLFSGMGLAGVALVLLLSAGIGTRFGLWHFRTGFALLKYAAYIGSIAALASGAGIFLSVGVSRKKCMVLGTAAFVAALTTVVIPLYWKFAASRVPRIHDISTDTANPPGFIVLLPLRKDATNPPEYGGAEIAIKQHAAYPDIKPLLLNLPADQAFARAAAAARDLRWQIVAELPGEGRIEATDTTRWFGFTDDIVIRITPAGGRSVIDVRSLSRVGVSDVGTNARRIRTFLQKLNS